LYTFLIYPMNVLHAPWAKYYLTCLNTTFYASNTILLLVTFMGKSFSLSHCIQTGHEADHPTPSFAGVNNMWNYTSIPPYVFKVWHLFNHQGQLYLYIHR
jgi:hypothetical protein